MSENGQAQPERIVEKKRSTLKKSKAETMAHPTGVGPSGRRGRRPLRTW